jgi:hypothetical protein
LSLILRPTDTLEFENINNYIYDVSTLYTTYPYVEFLSFRYTVDTEIPYSTTVLEQSNLNLVFTPKLRGKNYTTTIEAYDRFTDEDPTHSNIDLKINVKEVPAIKFDFEPVFPNKSSNIHTIVVDSLENTQVICNLVENIITYSDNNLIYTNIIPEISDAYYDNTTNKKAIIHKNTTINNNNITYFTPPDTGENTLRIESIDNKDFCIAFNIDVSDLSDETFFTIQSIYSTESTPKELITFKKETNVFNFNILGIPAIELENLSGQQYFFLNISSRKIELYINETNHSTVDTEVIETNKYEHKLILNSSINPEPNTLKLFMIIDKPITIDDIEYLFNNTDETILFYDSSNIYINPEYRNQRYIADIKLSIANYEEISRTVRFDITEEQIKEIELKQGITNLNCNNLLDDIIIVSNIKDLYNYPFSNHLVFETDIDQYRANITNGELILTADYRGIEYTVELTGKDINFNLSNSEFNVNMQEKPPIEFADLTNNYVIDLSNLDNTQIICNIIDNVIINVKDKTNDDLNILLPYNPTVRPAHYIDEANAYVFESSNITINPEYRNKYYELIFEIDIINYESQKITKKYNIEEINIPSIDIDLSINSNFDNLSNESRSINLKDYFPTYPFADKLQFLQISPLNIENRKEFITSTFNISVNTGVLTVSPDFRDSNYTLKILAYDLKFSYIDVNPPKFTQTSTDGNIIYQYNVDGYKTLNISQNIITELIGNDTNSNIVNELFELNFTEIAPIEFNNVIDIIYLCNLENTTELCNIYPNIKFNADIAPITTTFSYITTQPEEAFYKPLEELDAVKIINQSNVYIYPEYRNTSYGFNVSIVHTNYDTQPIIQTFTIHESNIQPIRFKYEDNEFNYSDQTNSPIVLDQTNDLKNYFDFPFADKLQYSWNSNIITENIPSYILNNNKINVDIDNSNITITPNYRGYNYTITITAFDTNFGESNNQFEITIGEKQPIELVNSSGLYSNFIVIDNLSNVDYIITPAEIYNKNTNGNTLIELAANTIDHTDGISYLKRNEQCNEPIKIDNNYIVISPYYRDTNKTYVYDIYLTTGTAETHSYQYFKLQLALNITELPIEPINVYNDTKVVYLDLSNNVIPITDLQLLYDYPFKEYLQFNYSNSHTGNYDITLTENDLTVIAGLRDQTYTLTLQAYDPLFTYHPDPNYVDCNLTGNTLNSNLINEVLQFEFQELPAIRFNDGSIGTKIIDITTSGNTQSNIDLMTIVEVFTDHSVFMLSNTSGLPRPAHYIEGDHSNAVFFGYPIDGTVSKTEDTSIYINPEYRGITYTADIDIYMSNYPGNTITLSLIITEELIPIIRSATTFDISRPVSITEVIIEDLKSQYDYVYSNQLQFTCNVIELNDTTLGYSVVLDGDTLTVDPDLRGNSYTVQIIAYDPNFTSNAGLGLDKTYCNLINDSLIFTFEETPSIYFKGMDYTELSKTISINAPNNTQILCNLTDILSNQTIEGVYIIESF